MDIFYKIISDVSDQTPGCLGYVFLRMYFDYWMFYMYFLVHEYSTKYFIWCQIH